MVAAAMTEAAFVRRPVTLRREVRYAVPGNYDAIETFRSQASRHWYKALRRRSQNASLTWERMRRFEARWLPPAKIMHPWPEQRFDARTQERSPVR